MTCRARALDITSYLNRFLHFSLDGDKHTYSVKDWQCVVPENIHNPHGKQRKFRGEGGGDKKEAISKGFGGSLSSRGFYFFFSGAPSKIGEQAITYFTVNRCFKAKILIIFTDDFCIEIRKPNTKPFLIATWYRPPYSSIDLF